MVVFLIAILLSCAKAESSKISQAEPPAVKPVNNTENSIEVGAGSGDLKIDGSDARLKDKNRVIIKSGTYNTVSIRNLHGTEQEPIEINNAGQVKINDVMDISNVSDVTIAGDNINGMKYGIAFHDNSYRAITMSGELIGVTLSNLSFKDVQDYVIFIKPTNREIGKASMERIKILNCKFENAAGIQFVSESGGNGEFIKDFEFAHNVIENANSGNFAYFETVQNYNIHHNTVNNLNADNDNHNGIFHMVGNGKFHDNKFTNYQGNMIRAWVFSRGNLPSTIEIYNNIAYNTRKYGAFEIQGFDRYIIPGKTTFANAKVYNNTVGKMNTSRDWEGVILDLYNYGGTLEYYNNLGFELNQSRPITDMINNMSDTKITKKTNNRYFNSASQAIFNFNNFMSKHLGIGSNLNATH